MTNQRFANLPDGASVTIGRIAAGTTVTREMTALMLADYMRTGEAKLWLDLNDNVATTMPLAGATCSLTIGTDASD